MTSSLPTWGGNTSGSLTEGELMVADQTASVRACASARTFPLYVEN